MFDPLKKRALPRFPRRLGIVTSPQAAALHDVLTALARRIPCLPVVVYPTPVQGAGAGAQIAAAIRLAGRRAECDVLLVCRGGGSLEDLWAFNDEAVARAIAASPIAVVSGVGHETDFTLADFAADVRAPTPTAAAELASPVRQELMLQLGRMARQLRHHLVHKHRNETQTLDYLTGRLIHPADLMRRQRSGLAQLAQRLRHAASNGLIRERLRLAHLGQRVVPPRNAIRGGRQAVASLAARRERALAHTFEQRALALAGFTRSLDHLNPENVLARGYSIVRLENGTIVQDASVLGVGRALQLRFHRGNARAVVESTSDD